MMDEIDHIIWLAGLFAIVVVLFIVSAPPIVAAFQTHRLRTVGPYRPNQWVKFNENAFEIEQISLWSWKFRALSRSTLRLSSQQVRKHFRIGALSGPLALIHQTLEVQTSTHAETVTQVARDTMIAMPEVTMAENLQTLRSKTLAGTYVVQVFGLTSLSEQESASRRIADQVKAQLKNIKVLMHEEYERTLH